jgi:hypothetical protein
MKYLALLVIVCAISMTTSSQADADYSIIRWTSGFCQIWDNSTPWKPFPKDYKAGRISFKTIDAATAARAQLIARRECFA